MTTAKGKPEEKYMTIVEKYLVKIVSLKTQTSAARPLRAMIPWSKLYK